MRRREFLKSAASATAAATLSGSAFGAKPGSRNPNVLLILTDDQGWGDIHSHANDQIVTPVCDKLAADGARFDRFFVAPLCAPTRAGLLTGRYQLRMGVSGVTRGLETMRANELTIADILKQAGYATGCFGKWHNGAHYPYHPNGRGFEEFLGFCGGHWNNYFDTTLDRNGKPVKVRGYIADVLTDAAIAFIEGKRNRSFFCYLAYNTPHAPNQVPDRYFDKYKQRGLDDQLACIYGMVENIDDNVGRLLKRLDELNLADDTIVLFLTDNGPNSDRYNGGMRGRKGSVDEGGVRVPLFVRWPGHIKAGSEIKQIAGHIDLLPTILDLCRVEKPTQGKDGGPILPPDGISLAPLLTGAAKQLPDRTIFFHRTSAQGVQRAPGSVRTQRYRLMIAPKRNELYDMIADPGQTTDIAGQQPDVAKRLVAAYDAWFEDVTKGGFDRLPIPVGHPQAEIVELPAPECYIEGDIAYKGRAGFANDWLTNWRSTNDYVWWDIDVVRAGRYEATIMYCCPAGDVGAKIRVEAGDQSLEGVVSRAHDPAPIPSPDRVPRGEVYEKTWAPLTLGVLSLPKGRTRLAVKALTKPGESVIDLKSVRLRRVN